MHQLLTIRFSHFNEKARWGLQRCGVPFRERGYLPMTHMLPVAWATRGSQDAAPDALSTRLSTPVLVTEEGERICDSSRIVRWANDHRAEGAADLYFDPECAALEQRFSTRLGGHTRRLAYYWVLDDPSVVRRMAWANVGPAQAALFTALIPVGRRMLRRLLSIDDENAARSRQAVLGEVAFASERLAGRRFLVGERFGAADLALACMLAPVLIVSHEEGYGAVLPPREDAHPDALAFATELRATPAGAHALRMFREERSGGPPPGS